jgi:hypothetical protein
MTPPNGCRQGGPSGCADLAGGRSRGMDESAARFLVTHREDPLTTEVIVELLGN